MRNIMFFIVFLIVGCQKSSSPQRAEFVRLPSAIEFQRAGFSEVARSIKSKLSEKDGYLFFMELYGYDTNAVNRFLADEFIANSCYELHFEWHVSTSNLVQHFSSKFVEAGWKVMKREDFDLEEMPAGTNWIRVYEKNGMKTHVHLVGLSSDNPEEYAGDDFGEDADGGGLPPKYIKIGFFNCTSDDVFDPAELYRLTNGVSSAEYNQTPGGYRKPEEREK